MLARAWGNLYLAEKGDGSEFTAADEHAALILAEWAGVAIENARLYARSEHRREQLERLVRGLDATRDVTVAIRGASDLDRVLELIVKRGRALLNARAVLILLRRGQDLEVSASAGYASDVRGFRLPIGDSTAGRVLENGRPERIGDLDARLRIPTAELGVSDAHAALLVPMMNRGVGVGVLAAFDRGEEGGAFSAADEQLLETFAASAANAVAIARSVARDRLRSSMAAADAERAKWARELHDETLQILGGLQILLAGALRRADPGGHEAAMREAMKQTERGIGGLRAIIADLRPASLDQLGLAAAIEALIIRGGQGPPEIVSHLDIPHRGDEPALDPELENTVYQLVQEGVTNAVRHAQATAVRVTVAASAREAMVKIEDDGVGFDVEAGAEGFGLAGMRERADLAGGTLAIDSSECGTVIRSIVPTELSAQRIGRSGRQ